MKIKKLISPAVYEDVEIHFPLSYKVDNRYYHYYTETSGIMVWKGSVYEEIHIMKEIKDFNDGIPCAKQDVIEAFNYVRDKATRMVFPTEYNPDLNLTDNMTEKELINELHRQSGLYGN